MIGKKFGTWEVIGKYQNKNNRFLCKCECGFMTIKYMHEIEKPTALSCMSCCKKNENTHFYGNKDNSNRKQNYSGIIIDGDINEYIIVALTDKDTFKDVDRADYVYIHRRTKQLFINMERLKVTDGGVIFVLCNINKNDTICVEFDDKTRHVFVNLETLIEGMKNTPNKAPILIEVLEVMIGYKSRLMKSLEKYKNFSAEDLKKAANGGTSFML